MVEADKNAVGNFDTRKLGLAMMYKDKRSCKIFWHRLEDVVIEVGIYHPGDDFNSSKRANHS